MAFNAGAVIAKFKSDLTDLKNGIGEAKSMMNSLKGVGKSVGDNIKSSFTDFMNTAKIVGAVGVGAFTLFAKSAIDLKSETDKANISLEIMAERFGHNAKEAKKLADSLGKELRIGTGSASEGLQNLIKSGLTLDQSADLMRRFTNEAMTGKSESISLADAVKNLTFAYATNNSALGNMSGVSENWSDITEKGKKILAGWNGEANKSAGITPELAKQIKAYEQSLKDQGKTLSASDDEMAKYIGLLQLTNLTAGSSAKFQGTYTDNLAMMGLKITEVKLALGTLLQDALNPLVLWFTNSGILDNIERFIVILGNLGTYIGDLLAGRDVSAELQEAFSFFTGGNMEQAKVLADGFQWLVEAFKKLGAWIAENKELILTFLTGLGIALGALLIIGTIIGLLNLLFNPITLIIVAVGLLFVAWKNNFLGIRDIVDSVIAFVMAIFESLKKFWEDWGGVITSFFTNLWSVIKGIWQVATALLMGIIGVFIGLLTGDWKKAGDVLQKAGKQAWDGIVNIFTGAFGLIMDGLHAFIKNFTDKLDGLFNKVREIGGNIKEALMQLNPFHKNSPSLVQYVEMGTARILDTYRGLASDLNGIDLRSGIMGLTGADIASQLAVAGAGQGGAGVTQNITMNVNDRNDAEFINERLAFMYRNSNL